MYLHLWPLESIVAYKLHYLPEKGICFLTVLPSLQERDSEIPFLLGAWCSLWVCTGTNLDWIEPQAVKGCWYERTPNHPALGPEVGLVCRQ